MISCGCCLCGIAALADELVSELETRWRCQQPPTGWLSYERVASTLVLTTWSLRSGGLPPPGAKPPEIAQEIPETAPRLAKMGPFPGASTGNGEGPFVTLLLVEGTFYQVLYWSILGINSSMIGQKGARFGWPSSLLDC